MYTYIHTHIYTQQNNEGKWEQGHHFQAHKSIVRSLAAIPDGTDAVSPSIHVASSSDDGLVKIWKLDGKVNGSEVVCVGTLQGTPTDNTNCNNILNKHKHSGSHLSVHTLNVRENQTQTQIQTRFAVGRRDGSVAYLEKNDECQPSSSQEPWKFNKSAQLFGSDSEGLVLVHICGHMCAVSRAGVIEVWQLGNDACAQDEDGEGEKPQSNGKDSEATTATDASNASTAVPKEVDAAAKAKRKSDEEKPVDSRGIAQSDAAATTTDHVAETTDAVAAAPRAQDETNAKASLGNHEMEGKKSDSSSSTGAGGKETGIDGSAVTQKPKEENTAKWRQLCILQSGMYARMHVCMYVT